MGMLEIRTTVDTGPGEVQQQFADLVDINKIVSGFEKTGMVTHLNKREPFYGDVSEISGYQESLNIVNRADELFMALSAEVRSRFANDPALMVEFLSDDKNLDEAIKLGMVVKRPEPVVEAIEPIQAKSKAKVKAEPKVEDEE